MLRERKRKRTRRKRGEENERVTLKKVRKKQDFHEG